MTSAAVLIRRGEKQDVHFLRDMVRHSGLGRSGFPIDTEPPPLSRYVAGWGRAGDQSVVALDDATLTKIIGWLQPGAVIAIAQ